MAELDAVGYAAALAVLLGVEFLGKFLIYKLQFAVAGFTRYNGEACLSARLAAINARACAGQGFAPRLGYGLLAILAVGYFRHSVKLMDNACLPVGRANT